MNWLRASFALILLSAALRTGSLCCGATPYCAPVAYSVQELPSLPGDSYAAAFDINDRCDIAGWSAERFTGSGLLDTRAVVWGKHGPELIRGEGTGPVCT